MNDQNDELNGGRPPRALRPRGAFAELSAWRTAFGLLLIIGAVVLPAWVLIATDESMSWWSGSVVVSCGMCVAAYFIGMGDRR